MRPTRSWFIAATVAITVPLAACGSNGTDTSSDGSTGTTAAGTPGTQAVAGANGPGKDSAAVGFIFVGPKDDFGYNQAAFQGSQAVQKAFPDMKVLTAENVPETDEAARVMEGMIAKGAKIIFATSYGHLDAAMKVAADHPDVAVVQQGNFIKGTIPANAGTYFGTVFEPVYLAGIVAGKSTKSNKLGFVYAFPITQTIENIDAFELGAKSVNPAAQTFVVNTSSWCDPPKQADAAKSLLDQGVDVLTQHQDCTATITKAAEAAGKMVVGYHADASSLAPNGWIAGSEWAWADTYIDIVKTARAGTFTGSKYNANFRQGLKDGSNPFVESKFGPSVSEDTKALVAKAKADIAGSGSPFKGPVFAQDGSTLIPAGDVPDYAAIEAKLTVFVQGVVGQIPKG